MVRWNDGRVPFSMLAQFCSEDYGPAATTNRRASLLRATAAVLGALAVALAVALAISRWRPRRN